MNKKSYKRILALCFALMSSSSCSADKSHIQKSLLQDTYNQNAIPVKQIENRKSNGTQSGNLLLPLSFMGALTLASVGAAKYSGLGPFADKPKKPDNPEIPGVPPKKPDNPEETPDEAPAPDPFVPGTPKPGEDSIAPVLSGEDIKIFKANFEAERKNQSMPYVGDSRIRYIKHGITCAGGGNHNQMFYLDYDGDSVNNVKDAPENYVERIAALLPLLGKKYTGSDADDEITKYIQNNIAGEYNCITIYTIPEGPDKDKIWLVVDGITKTSFTEYKDGYFYFDDQEKIYVKADEKNMKQRYGMRIDQFDIRGNNGDNVKDMYRIYNYKVEKIPCGVDRKEKK